MSSRIEVLKQFVVDEPENPFNKYALGVEYLSLDINQALKWLNDVLDAHPDYLPVYYQSANLYWELGDVDKAESLFQLGIELATKENDQKTLRELQSAYQNLQFELD